jgi:hypothetical protein
MKIKGAWYLLLSLLIMSWTTHDTTTVLADEEIIKDGCGTANLAFQPGEEIVYKIYYNLSPFWVSAGEVKFKIEDAGTHYRFKVTGYTYKSLEWFYKAVYTFESEVDKKSLMPRQFVRTIQEKKYSKYNKFLFDQNTGLVTTWEGKTISECQKNVQYIGQCMHDMISVLYYMRNMNFDNLRVGENVPIDIFLEEKYPLSVHITGKNEEKRIKGLGKHMTHVFSPEVIAGEVFSDETQMSVWVSADQNRFPLMIESPVRVGKVKAVLHEYKGLRHYFNTEE